MPSKCSRQELSQHIHWLATQNEDQEALGKLLKKIIEISRNVFIYSHYSSRHRHKKAKGL